MKSEEVQNYGPSPPPASRTRAPLSRAHTSCLTAASTQDRKEANCQHVDSTPTNPVGAVHGPDIEHRARKGKMGLQDTQKCLGPLERVVAVA